MSRIEQLWRKCLQQLDHMTAGHRGLKFSRQAALDAISNIQSEMATFISLPSCSRQTWTKLVVELKVGPAGMF